MKRWITVLLPALVVLGCSNSETTGGRGPQTPELPSARARGSAPVEATGSGEATAGYTEPNVLPAVQLPVGQRPTPRTCPMSLDGTSVRVVEEGIGQAALEYSAPYALLGDLTAAVTAQAEAYARRAPRERAVPTYRVRQQGLRIMFEPTNPSELDALRGDLIEHATVMQETRSCPVE